MKTPSWDTDTKTEMAVSSQPAHMTYSERTAMNLEFTMM